MLYAARNSGIMWKIHSTKDKFVDDLDFIRNCISEDDNVLGRLKICVMIMSLEVKSALFRVSYLIILVSLKTSSHLKRCSVVVCTSGS